MKVLLIQSPLVKKGNSVNYAFPLGLASLAGALKDIELTVFDPNASENPFGAIEQTIAKTAPDVIGLSLRNIDTALSSDVHSYLDAFTQTVETADANRGSAKLVVGGTGFSIFPIEIMQRFPQLDFGLFLEGENSFPQLLKNLDCPNNVKGIYYRSGKEVRFTGKADPVDFAELDAPPRELNGINLDWYKNTPHSFGVQTKRGCAFRCAYCTYPYLQGNSVRVRSPKKIVDEIENLVNNYGVKSIFFADTIFNYPFEHSRQVCQEITRRKIKVEWGAWYRENYINKQFLLEAQEAGCVCFEFSPDGTSQQALDALHKDITVQDIKRTAELMHEIGDIKVNYNFLRNVPGENLKSVSSFHRLLPWLLAKNRKQIGFVGFNSIRIYPHTAIYETALQQGFITADQDLIKPTFYDPFPLNTAYLPARCTNYLYLKMQSRVLPFVSQIRRSAQTFLR